MEETNAERLTRLLKKALPDMDPDIIEKGEWGPEGSPYYFSTTRAGAKRLTVVNRDTSDQMGFVGPTVTNLIDQLETRVASKE